MKQEKIYTYQAIKSLNTWIKVIVWLFIVSQIILMPVLYWFFDTTQTILLNSASQGIDMQDELNLIARFANLVGAVAGLIFMISVLLIGIWIYRSHKNARALQVPDIQHAPAWAVGSFFVPIVNLFVPYRAMKSMVSGSLKLAGQPNLNLAYWWGAWVLGNLISRASSRWFSRMEEELPEARQLEDYVSYFANLQNSLYLDALSSVFLIVSAVLLLKIMQATNQAHQILAKQRP